MSPDAINVVMIQKEEQRYKEFAGMNLYAVNHEWQETKFEGGSTLVYRYSVCRMAVTRSMMVK